MNRIDPDAWTRNAWRNRLQTSFLLAAMAGFAALIGYVLWGGDGMLVLLIAVGLGTVISPTLPPWVIMRLYGARRLAPEQVPELWAAVTTLSQRAGLPRPPDLYYLPSRMLNAFAVGSRKRAVLGLTDGLLRQLAWRELVGVMAHEVSHIRSNDLRVMGLADLISRATMVLSLIGQLMLLVNLPLILLTDVAISWLAIALLIAAPSFSALAQLALSRTREFDADLNAARLTGDPDGLAQALVKIDQVQGGWLERVFLPGRRVPEPSLLRTHPPTEERIARLMELKPELRRWDDYQLPFAHGQGEWYRGLTPVRRPPRWWGHGLWH